MQLQQHIGRNLVQVGDFAYCDPVLNTLLFEVQPKRNQAEDGEIDFDCQFRMDCGR